jgi:hypothetical protein
MSLSDNLKLEQNIKNQYLLYLLTNPNPIDTILISDLTISEKIKLFDIFVSFSKFNESKPLDIGLSKTTMTLLLERKEDTSDYICLFEKIVNFSQNFFSDSILTYEHLYRMIIQSWMDLPSNFTNEFKKKLITIALKEGLSDVIIQEFKINALEWFINLKNKNIGEMINWLCMIDASGELTNIKNTYELNLEMEEIIEKEFKKKYNMSKKEYEMKQHNNKKNGLCQFVRKKTNCPHNKECKFYHGKLEETYGVQPCRSGEKCKFLITGECKFVHQPTKNQMLQITNFYKCLHKTNFCVTKKQSTYIDKQCKTNPFIILMKTNDSNNYVQYCIPRCSCPVTDTFGIVQLCNKPVVFMTKNVSGEPEKFYCSYEHMNKMEIPSFYCVKQNTLSNIID